MTWREAAWPAFKRLLQRSSAPVLVGPFRGEVGFEALYWVPFVRALGIPKERLIPVTRGGAHVWYHADRHVELYSLRTPKEVRIENTLTAMRTGKLKQERRSDWDAAVIRDAASRLGLSRYHVLHPSWMYRLLEPFWMNRRGYGWLSERVSLQTLPPVAVDGLELPENFVAVRFYARTTFPLNDVCVTVAKEAVKRIAQQHPVVVLTSGVHADEHVDMPLAGLPNVTLLTERVQVPPEHNLAIQSAVLSKCLGFVGTYGGLAQLAMLYRKPTVSFYQDWQGTMVAHKHLADAIAMQVGVACQVLRVNEIPLLHTTVPNLRLSAPTSSGGALQPDRLTAASVA